MPPKRTSKSKAPAMTQAAIKKLVADSVTTALKEQAATMASISNPNRNIGPTRTPITKMRNYKEFINCHPFYFNEELSTTTPTIATTTTSVTPTPTTTTTITNHNRTKDKKLSKLMMPLQLRNSFTPISLASMLDIPPIIIDTFYDIKMADKNLYHAKILCDEKVVHIPIDGETLIIRVREFPKVFPEDLLGLPTVSQVEFQIDLIPGVAPVARAPYRLAPTEMHELSNQLQKLAD
ncbi:hypothetical protein Tco_0140571 [Tanacetum coccineum]